MQAEISAAPTTDHSVITVTLMPDSEITFRQKYRKFYANFLNDEYFCDMVKKKKILYSVETNEEIDSYGNVYDIRFIFFKYKVIMYSIDYGKRQLIKDINDCCKKDLSLDSN